VPLVLVSCNQTDQTSSAAPVNGTPSSPYSAGAPKVVPRITSGSTSSMISATTAVAATGSSNATPPIKVPQVTSVAKSTTELKIVPPPGGSGADRLLPLAVPAAIGVNIHSVKGAENDPVILDALDKLGASIVRDDMRWEC